MRKGFFNLTEVYLTELSKRNIKFREILKSAINNINKKMSLEAINSGMKTIKTFIFATLEEVIGPPTTVRKKINAHAITTEVLQLKKKKNQASLPSRYLL